MKHVNVCVVGYGAIGSLHFDSFMREKDVSISVVETDKTKCNLLAERGVVVHASIDEALHHDYDLFDVCVPTHVHRPVVERLLMETKAEVLCEKPLAMDGREAKEIVDLPGAKQRLACALVEHFHEPFQAMKLWTASNAPPFAMTFSRRTKKPTDAPWFNKPELGGDLVLDLAIHDIDLALWFTEMKVVDVSKHKVAGDVESFMLTFQDASTAHIYAGWDLPFENELGIENHVLISSESGAVSYDSNQELLATDANTKTVISRFPTAYYSEITAALDFVRTGKNKFPALSKVKEGLAVFDAIVKSRDHEI